MVRNTQIVHASLATHITPLALATHAMGPLRGMTAMAALNQEVTAQATMIAYLDDFYLMLILTVLALPLLLLVRPPRSPGGTGVKNVPVEQARAAGIAGCRARAAAWPGRTSSRLRKPGRKLPLAQRAPMPRPGGRR